MVLGRPQRVADFSLRLAIQAEQAGGDDTPSRRGGKDGIGDPAHRCIAHQPSSAVASIPAAALPPALTTHTTALMPNKCPTLVLALATPPGAFLTRAVADNHKQVTVPMPPQRRAAAASEVQPAWAEDAALVQSTSRKVQITTTVPRDPVPGPGPDPDPGPGPRPRAWLALPGVPTRAPP